MLLEQYGPYLLVQREGELRHAEVFRAFAVGPEGFRRPATVYRMFAEAAMDVDRVQALAEDARRAAFLRHPNVAQVHDFGRVRDSYFVATERVEGCPLTTLVGELSEVASLVPPAMIAEIGRQLCLGAAAIHALTATAAPAARGHGGIVPARLIVTAEGTAKILGFGLSRALLAHSGRGGNRSYLAPEQLQGGAVDGRADVYALGAVLHELLSLRPVGARRNGMPDSDETDGADVPGREAPLPPPSSLNPNVPAALDRILMKALARDPAGRYQSASDMAEDLEEVALGARISARLVGQTMVAVFGAPPSWDEIDAPRGARDVAAQQTAPANVLSPSLRVWRPYRLIGGIAVAAVTAGLVGFGLARRAPRATRPPAAATLPVAGAARAPAPVPALVRIRIDSTPHGASVLAGNDGRLLTKTPGTVQLPGGTATTELIVRRPGFRDMSVRFAPDADRTVSVKLERVPGSTENTASATAAR